MAQHNKKKVTILSIDGGGIRGLIPAVFLARLEKEIQRITNNSEARLSEYFDLMIGTSTGGLLSILYATPSEDGTRSKYSAEEGVKLYKKHGPMIFPSSWFWARKFFRNKYSPNYLNNLLLRKLGDTKLGSLRTPVAITAFNTTTDSAYIFRSWRASNQAQDFYLRDVARATSAAPTYFPPAEFGFVGTDSDATPKQSFIDGGVSANNPSLIALGLALTLSFGEEKVAPKDISDVIIVSIGTGRVQKADEYTKKRGLLGWAFPIVDTFMRGNSQEVDYTLHDLSMATTPPCPRNFLRINPFLGCPEGQRLLLAAINEPTIQKIISLFENGPYCNEDLDCSTRNNISELEALGHLCADNISSLLDIKLPNCHPHQANYDDIDLTYIANQLIENKAQTRVSLERVAPF